MEIYGKEIDVIRILKKIHEIDKLKKLILSDQQLFLFNSVSRLLLDFNENEKICNKNLTLSQMCVSYNEKITNKYFEDVYKQLKNESKENEINRKLIEIVDSNLTKLSYLDTSMKD